MLAAALAANSQAAISDVSPGDGDVVTVDTSAPNPDTLRIYRPGNTNVTVNVLSGATIDHGGSYAVGLGTNGVVNNAGTISAGAYAIQLSDGGRINNSGTVTTPGAHAIDLTGDVNVTNRGTITGASSSILFGGEFDPNTNQTSSHDNRLILEPGSNITHYVDADAGTDTLILGGTTGSDSFDLDLVGNGGPDIYRDFEVFTKEGDSTWTVTGSNANDWTVSAGTLRVEGTLAGSTTLDGGTLRVRSTADLGTRAISVGATGGTIEPYSNSTTLANDIALSGDLTAAGDQTLTLDGDLTGGGGLIKNGTKILFLRGDNTFGGDIEINGNSVIAIGSDAVPDGSVVRINGGGNFQTYSRETIGGLEGSGSVGFNGQTITLDVDAADDPTHSGVLQGSSGVLLKSGAGTQTLAGSGPAGLALQLDRGTLIVNGGFDGDATVNAGTFGGSGSVGTLSVSNARVAPGNSIGTLNVTGDVSLDADSTYDIELDGNGASDLIDATGSATLASGTTLAVAVVANDNLVSNGDRWTVISAGGGVADGGALITEDFAGFSFTGAVNGNDYQLTAVSEALADAVTGPTAGAAAAALDADRSTASPDLSTFITTVSNQTPTRAQQTLDATHPRAVSATQTVSHRVSERFHGNLGAYLSGRRLGMPQLANRGGGSTGGGFQLASAAATDPLLLAAYFARAEHDQAGSALRTDFTDSAETDSPWGGFAAVYGVQTDRDAAADATGSRSDTYAAQAGVDQQLNDRWLVGVSINYAQSELDFNDVAGDNLGGNDVDTLRVGPYAGYADGPWSADASLTLGYHQNDATRRVPGLGAGTGDAFEGDYDSYDLAAYVGGGYRVDLDGWQITPRVSVQYVYGETDGYTESGGPGALVVDSADFDALRGTAGLGVSRLFDLGRVRLMPRAEVGYAHQFLDGGDDLSARFVGGSTGFTVATADNEGGSVYYGAGLTALVNHRTALDLDYFGETSDDNQIDTLRLTLRLAF